MYALYYNSIFHYLVSSNFMNKSENDYKSAIVSIIATSQTLMTVKAVMDSFKIKYGYSFPLEQLSCRTPMDFFRLHPALFKVPQMIDGEMYRQKYLKHFFFLVG